MITGSGLGDANERVRAVVNGSSRVKARLMSDRSAWLTFCASLDAIEDTNLALGAFESMWAAPHSGGSAVLVVYGALQSLLVQQDAVKRVFERAIEKEKWKKVKKLERIRAVRNQAAGHPDKEAGFLVHGSLSRRKPELLLPERADRRHEMIELDFETMIREQREILASALDRVSRHLQDLDRKHMSKFAPKPLKPFVVRLNSAITDANRELWKTTDSASPMFGGHVDDVVKKLDQFERAVKERGELEARSDTLGPQLRFARHCLARLKLLAARGATGEYHDDAQAFIHALEHTCKGLAGAANEIDTEYTAGCDQAASSGSTSET